MEITDNQCINIFGLKKKNIFIRRNLSPNINYNNKFLLIYSIQKLHLEK